MEIIQSSKFQQDCQIYKKSKADMKEIATFIDKTIQKNTKEEVKQVEESIKRLNQKVERIMKDKRINEKKKQLDRAQESMIMSLQSVMDIYKQARGIILKDTTLTNQQRMKYLEKLETKMMDKLYSPEEKANFKRMVSNMIIMMPRQKMPMKGDNLLTL